MRRETKRIVLHQLRMRCSAMQVILVRMTKKRRRKKGKEERGVAAGAEVGAKVEAEVVAEVEAEVGVGAGVGVRVVVDPRAVGKDQVIELLSKT